LSQRLEELMAGTITVRSVVGVGCTFTLRFPTAATPHEEAQAGAEGDVRRTSNDEQLILYIEDNAPNIRLVTRILSRRPGARLLAAMHGALGLELARQHRPALVLLDLHLPDISGAEVLQALRSEPETQDIPVIVVSADATTRQQQLLLAGGARAYVTKPFDVKQLLGAISAVLGDPATPTLATSGSGHGND
jgi:CheY-like chemotaxis protein